MTRTDCYWYHEYQDMNARVPTCEYYGEYGKCLCVLGCDHFIDKDEVSGFIRDYGIKIVRCKDCEYWNNETSLTYCNKGHWYGTDADDYCSFAKLKSNN